MNIIEVSAHFQEWRACVREAKKQPLVLLWQYLAAKAQMKLVCAQSQYWGETQ